MSPFFTGEMLIGSFINTPTRFLSTTSTILTHINSSIKTYRIKDSKSAPSKKISNSKIPSKMECVNQYTIKELQKEARKLKRVNHTSAPLHLASKKHTKI